MTLPQVPFKARSLMKGAVRGHPPHGVGFSREGRVGRFGNRPKAFAYLPGARNGLLRRGRSYAYDFLLPVVIAFLSSTSRGEPPLHHVCTGTYARFG